MATSNCWFRIQINVRDQFFLFIQIVFVTFDNQYFGQVSIVNFFFFNVKENIYRFEFLVN